jgi:hypothetical protein
MLWGRLGYDPELGRERFEGRLAQRFPSVDATGLYESWQSASQIIPLVNRFYWRNWDYMWSVENSNSLREGYHGVERFSRNQPMQGSGILPVRKFVAIERNGASVDKITPLEVADELDALAKSARQGAEALLDGVKDADLRATLDDCIGMSMLGEYYAAKIRAAVALARFEHSRDPTDKANAVTHINAAFEACTRYVDHSQVRYHAQMLARSGLFDWAAMLSNAQRDVSFIRELKVAQE